MVARPEDVVHGAVREVRLDISMIHGVSASAGTRDAATEKSPLPRLHSSRQICSDDAAVRRLQMSGAALQ